MSVISKDDVPHRKSNFCTNRLLVPFYEQDILVSPLVPSGDHEVTSGGEAYRGVNKSRTVVGALEMQKRSTEAVSSELTVFVARHDKCPATD